MKIGRTIPPAAAPIRLKDVWYGLRGLVSPDGALKAAEDTIREEFGVAHVFLVSSGTAALALTLEALKALSPRREVVIPAYTCFSVPAAVLLGFSALVLARRGREQSQRTLGRSGGELTARMGRALGFAALCLAVAALLALGFYGLLTLLQS